MCEYSTNKSQKALRGTLFPETHHHAKWTFPVLYTSMPLVWRRKTSHPENSLFGSHYLAQASIYGKRDGLSFGLWLLESIDTKGTLQTTAFFSWWDTQEKESSLIRRGAKKKPLSEKMPSRLCQKLLPFSSDCVPFKENILLLKHCK